MKRLTFILIGLFFITISCKKNHTCACVETYNGLNKNYVNETDSIIEGKKEDEAASVCDEGDLPNQTVMTETYGIECELK